MWVGVWSDGKGGGEGWGCWFGVGMVYTSRMIVEWDVDGSVEKEREEEEEEGGGEKLQPCVSALLRRVSRWARRMGVE